MDGHLRGWREMECEMNSWEEGIYVNTWDCLVREEKQLARLILCGQRGAGSNVHSINTWTCNLYNLII